MITRKTLVAALIPIAGICALVAHAEMRQRAADRWLIPIAGYDPRDLLSGHYLQFRYDWPKLGVTEEGCRFTNGQNCCVCLEPGPGGDLMHPHAETMACLYAKSCTAWVSDEVAFERGRVYIPENEGDRLQTLVRDRRAAVQITPQRSGKPAVNALYIDERPWQEAEAK